MWETTTVQDIIETLLGGGDVLDLVLRSEANPSVDWTHEQLDSMVKAATQNTNNITQLRLRGQLHKFSQQTIRPFVTLLEHSSTIKKIEISFSGVPGRYPCSYRGGRGRYPNRNITKQQDRNLRNIIDMLYGAILRNNKNLPLKALETTVIDGDYQLLQQFLSSLTKIESLTIQCDEPVCISSDTARALASSLSSVTSLREVNFNFVCYHDDSWRDIILGLQNHPTIEKVVWEGSFDYTALGRMLTTLCTSCPKIQDVSILHSNPYGPGSDITPMLRGMRFSDTLQSLTLSGVLIGDNANIMRSSGTTSWRASTSAAPRPRGISCYRNVPLLPRYSSLGLRCWFQLNKYLSCLNFRRLQQHPMYTPSTNKTISTLALKLVEFQGSNPLSILQHFTGLKKVTLESCRNITANNADVLGELEDLEEIEIFFDPEWIGESEHDTMANITQILKQGPPKVSLADFHTDVTTQLLSDIVAGLQSRQKPSLKKFGLEGFADWQQGTFNLFRTSALPLLSDVEDLAIYFNSYIYARGKDEVLAFLVSLSTLEHLKSLKFGYYYADRDTAKAILNIFRKNDVIDSFDGLDWPHSDTEMNLLRYHIQIYAFWNRYGRQLLRDPNIPIGLWPHVLAKLTKDGQDHNVHKSIGLKVEFGFVSIDVVFEYVKALNVQVHLF